MSEYVTKSPGMNSFLNALFPHSDNECPTCHKPIGEFRDPLSRREYIISHMCQACQDSMWPPDQK